MQQKKVFEVCADLEQALISSGLSRGSLECYQKVLAELSVYGGDQIYTPSIGTKFLVEKFGDYGGLVTTDKHSRSEHYYYRCIRILAEYYCFGVIHLRSDIQGEIIWPEPFRKCNEDFIANAVKDNLSYGYVTDLKVLVKDLVLFLSARDIFAPEDILPEHGEEFIKTFIGFSPRGIARKIGMLRRYYRFLYLNSFNSRPLHEFLPTSTAPGRQKYPTVWSVEDVEKIKAGADRISPNGKRGYAMVMLAANLGLRIGDIRDLKLTDIDWRNRQLSIVQGKTGQPLTLPLDTDTGWALIDYIKNGRPITDSPNVFVKHKSPYQAFNVSGSLNYILTEVLVKADIPPEAKENVGWHTFRRSLATHLLQGNVEMSTISEILGHSDPEIAGKHYVKLDTDDLRKCALDMEVKDYVREQ